jgi:nucleotide-binding universal stress UspA family protein
MRILLAVDDSALSAQAARAIGAQFPPRHTEVRVLHVLQPMTMSPLPQMSAGYAPELQEQGKHAHEFVERIAATLHATGFKTEVAVEKGDVRERIIDSAVEWHADLIVVGSQGREGVRRFLLGSVAEFVTRNAPCSVEIVRPPANQ